MRNERLGLASKMVSVLMALPEAFKLSVYQSFIFTEDEEDMMMGVDNSDFIPDDEALVKEINEKFNYWSVDAVKRYVKHAEGVQLVLSSGMDGSLVMTSVNGGAYSMETLKANGTYLSVVVTKDKCISFAYDTSKTAMDYLMSPLIDVDVELLEA
jgi:hypothetical protein